MPECFTCSHKLCRERTNEEIISIKEQNKVNGKRWHYVSDLAFKCKISNKEIRQTDTACDNYQPNSKMVNIRKDISKSARKMLEELRD